MFQRSRHRRLPPGGECVRDGMVAGRTDLERWKEPKADMSKCSLRVGGRRNRRGTRAGVDACSVVTAGFQPQPRYQTLFMTGDITDHAHQLIAAYRCHFLRKAFELRDVWESIAALAPRMDDARR